METTPKNKLANLKTQLWYHIQCEDDMMVKIVKNKIEKAMRNKVKVNAKGKFLLEGLNDKEKESLRNLRKELSKKVDALVIDDYIIALYNEEENEVYFVDENSTSKDPRAEIY